MRSQGVAVLAALALASVSLAEDAPHPRLAEGAARSVLSEPSRSADHGFSIRISHR